MDDELDPVTRYLMCQFPPKDGDSQILFLGIGKRRLLAFYVVDGQLLPRFVDEEEAEDFDWFGWCDCPSLN